MRVGLRSTCHSCPARGFKAGIRQPHLVLFHVFVSVDELSIPACSVDEKKRGGGNSWENVFGDEMAFYDLEPWASYT